MWLRAVLGVEWGQRVWRGVVNVWDTYLVRVDRALAVAWPSPY